MTYEQLSAGYRQVGKLLCILITTGSMALSGCVTGPRASEDAARQAKTFIVPHGKSSIYVYRPRTFSGSAGLINVTLDDDIVGALGIGDFLTRTVDPGRHTIYTENATVITIPAKTSFVAEPNSKYFIQVDLDVASWTTNKISQVFVDPEIAENVLINYKMVEWIE